jgi:penicillin-binding protein 1A
MQMATGYAVFANGGYRVNPWLISKITDNKGKVLVETQPPLPTEAMRAIDARNAFIMDRLLQEIVRSGTAARAYQALKRNDLYGKTGTTNDSIDTWFNGFHPHLVAVVWMGYDTPRNLGDRETGGSLSLPVWINFMESALKGVPEVVPTAPEGVVNVNGEWFYEEYSRGNGVSSLGVGPAPGSEPLAPIVPGNVGVSPAAQPRGPIVDPSGGGGPEAQSMSQPQRSDERRSILDLFRN